MKRLLVLFDISMATLRSNTLHTFLSTLGLVIGVAALVAILSLGDGLEKYARDQISTTTDLESVIVAPKTRSFQDGVSVERDSVPDISLDQVAELSEALSDVARIAVVKRMNTVVRLQGDTLQSGAFFDMTQNVLFDIREFVLRAGSRIPEDEGGSYGVVISTSLAANLSGTAQIENVVGKTLLIKNQEATIVGIIDSPATASPVAYGLHSVWQPRFDHPYPAGLYARAFDFENVLSTKDRIVEWLDSNLSGGSDNYSVITNQFRLEQAEKGIKLFKIVMGLITGIAVLVGGIGIMNVLLISINERTKEIGVRKATGARKGDIVMQFLTEAVTISIAGSIVGLLVGLGTLAIAIPIIQHLADVPFGMSFSGESLAVVMIIAVFIGIVFGTYPAWRASKLSPVDAIRHE